jgi:outer membrane protein assembly factor BamB
MPKVDQVKGRRAGLGLRGHDEEQAYQGFTLFCANTGPGEVFLIDMEGNVAHKWDMPYPPGLYGYITPEGTLFYNGKVVDPEDESFWGKAPWKGGVVLEADWDGNILRELKHPAHHHDGSKLKNGNVVLLCIAELEEEFQKKVRGGLPGSEAEGNKMYADYIVEMTWEGEEVWRWNSWEHLDPWEHGLAAPNETRAEWTHGNSVFEMEDGNLLVSFRNPSKVVIIDRATGDVIWHVGPPHIAQQHAPHELDNGNILIYDNGTSRLHQNIPHSRVVEIDRETREEVWSFQEKYPSDFFSPLISNASRLPNGNTLICEGSFGRFFEVTSEGEVVWEYVSPHFYAVSDEPDALISNRVFRCYRYSAEEISAMR